LKEYYKYFNSFSEVVDKEEDELEKIDSSSREGRAAEKQQRKCDKIEKGDGEEDYNPCKFRQWMEISIAGDS
jgi:hypothetical protein